MCAKRACRAFRQNSMLALLACVRPGTKRRAVLCITRLPPRKCTLPTVAATRQRAEHQYNALKEKSVAAPLGDYFQSKKLHRPAVLGNKFGFWKIKKGRRDVCLFLSGKRDSDPRPQPWQGCALPTELFPRFPFGECKDRKFLLICKI